MPGAARAYPGIAFFTDPLIFHAFCGDTPSKRITAFCVTVKLLDFFARMCYDSRNFY